MDARAKDYDETINEVVAAWTEYAVRALREKLKQRGMVMTAELQQSISFQISAAQNGMAQAILNLKPYGRFRDMKALKYTTVANFAAILGFVERKGLDAFKYVPGYDPAKRKVNKLPTTSVAMNRIAWGIAWSRLRKSSGRRKQWLNKFFYGPIVGQLIDSLIEQTGTTAVQVVEHDISAAFNDQ